MDFCLQPDELEQIEFEQKIISFNMSDRYE